MKFDAVDIIQEKIRSVLFSLQKKKKKKRIIKQTSHYKLRQMLCEVFSESSLHLPHIGIITVFIFFTVVIILGIFMSFLIVHKLLLY